MKKKKSEIYKIRIYRATDAEEKQIKALYAEAKKTDDMSFSRFKVKKLLAK